MDVLIFFLSPITALLTFRLSFFKNTGAIKASTITTLLFYGILKLLYPHDDLTDDLGAIIFGASFIGMASVKKFNNKQIIFAGILYPLLVKFLAPQLFGFGGTLGFLAFIAISINFLVFKKFNKFFRVTSGPNS